jgi:hypothetical protein
MKKIPAGTIFALLAFFAFGGCSGFFLAKPSDNSGGPVTGLSRSFGSITVNLSQGAERTLIPSLILDHLYLEYLFAKDGGTPAPKTPEGDKFILEPGTYRLEVRAFVDAAKEKLAAQGDADFAVSAGRAGTVNLSLRPVTSGGGTGSLNFSLEYPAGAEPEIFTLSPIAGEEDPIDLKTAGSVSGVDPVSFSGTKTGIPLGYYLLQVVLRDESGALAGRTEVAYVYQNLAVQAAYTFSADDFRFYRVNSAADEGPGTLRQALRGAPAGQTIRVTLEPGSVIELESPLAINKSLAIEGNGVTLTRAASWTAQSETSQLLRITNSSQVRISRVHFKNGVAGSYGGAVDNRGTLTMESCIFSGNRTTGTYGYGGAVYSANNLTIRGCTFYGNTANYRGGAVYFAGSGNTLTLTGNLFYGNTAGTASGAGYPAVYNTTIANTVNASYNTADAAFGTGTAQSGWTAATGNVYVTALTVLPGTFKVLYGNPAAAMLPDPPPEDYPAADFYGNAISGGGAAGSVQTVTPDGYFWLEIPVNDDLFGSVSVSPAPNGDGLIPNGAITLTATASGDSRAFAYWLQSGDQVRANPYSLVINGHTRIQAVFGRLVTVHDLGDGAGSESQVSLRYALGNAQDNDVIRVSGVTPGATAIELESALPQITKSIVIEGNGVTLTRAASWTGSSDTSQLLYINNTGALVGISGVHFKNGLATERGGAIRSNGTLTLESCIFSGNQTTSTGANNGGGAVNSSGKLIIRGCTFYGNTAGGSGGAVGVQNATILTLTGNLFYGNTAGSMPVLYRYNPNAANFNASYNVVDVDFGMGAGESGWAAEEGDTTFTALTIAGVPFNITTFVPVIRLRSVLPGTAPTGFPTTDFNGAVRTFPGAPGAIK